MARTLSLSIIPNRSMPVSTSPITPRKIEQLAADINKLIKFSSNVSEQSGKSKGGSSSDHVFVKQDDLQSVSKGLKRMIKDVFVVFTTYEKIPTKYDEFVLRYSTSDHALQDNVRTVQSTVSKLLQNLSGNNLITDKSARTSLPADIRDNLKRIQNVGEFLVDLEKAAQRVLSEKSFEPLYRIEDGLVKVELIPRCELHGIMIGGAQKVIPSCKEFL
jgi:hypothetical protein